ncbi:hypothetical protein FZC79_08605 [Rossellomorea vietnamensis]|uniref:SCP2 domain-containing protein n=1 Tax=Rossellomorea vietnamensis TaxID=218284 RepID=A0A5D4KH48_9BACI|nr:hypothetical protein [Rossellomorea vietnamensis]TYR76200.1 hypothetical protein FZC79_08605 [Rossellomorea vietnamensis]
MEKEILRMLDECKMRYHLKALMPEKPFIVAFDNGCEIMRVALGRRVELAIVSEEDQEADFIIKGSPLCIQELLSGKEKLSVLSRRQEVNVTGTYRGLLFIESILTLCRVHNSEPVVI